MCLTLLCIPALLAELEDRGRRGSTATDEETLHLQRCIDAAVAAHTDALQALDSAAAPQSKVLSRRHGTLKRVC